jgi:signal transduction histidine kinase
MIQTEKMMSVGGLAAGMAHEINNPLGSILGGVQNCLRRLSPELERNRAEARRQGLDIDALHAYLDSRGVLGFLEGIRDSGVRASEIVRNMLDFSRSSGSSRSPSNLNELLDKAVALASSDYDLKKRYDFRQVEIVRAYDPDLPAAMVYETEVEQVFLNLLKNAAQAMPDVADPGHRPRLDLETFVEGGMVVVRIADNGPGMDDETRKRVFEPFFTTKPPGVGTGLGLSVSYFIVTENHGGSFEVQSQPGRGTSFTVRLPLSAR